MRGKRKLGIALVFAGLFLLCAAGGLLLYNQAESDRAQDASVKVLEQLAEQIQANLRAGENAPTESTSGDTQSAVEKPPLPTEEDLCPTVQIDGVDYVGVISFPTLSLELPVMAQWSPEGLQTAPGRYSGTAAARDLVIAGHNYDAHFGQLEDLNLDDPVLFTDANGKVYSYAVLDIEILPPTAIEDMIAGDYPLTVFTCTYGGRTRLTIRCG
ncbi:MAG: sortase [Oscillospiraceae bacterium]|nr:sortase [Oscillospiraceae bacterium]